MKLNSSFLVASVSAVILAVGIAQAAEPTAREIMERNDQAQRYEDLQAKASLATGGGTRKPSSKEFQWSRRLKEDGVHFETLTKFTAPAEVRDEAILFLENGDENEVLLYLPAFKKVRRVESQQQSGSFMASDFSYSDITAAHVSDFDHKLTKTEACPGTATVKCWVIESTPARDSVKERMQYSKIRTWVRQDNFMAERGEYHDLGGALVKRLALSGIKKMAGSGSSGSEGKSGSAGKTGQAGAAGKDRFFAHQLRMERVGGAGVGQFTKIDFSDVKINQGVDRSLFAKQNLGRR